MPASGEQSASNDEVTKVQDIRKLLEVTGAGQQGIVAMKQVVESYKAMELKVPEKFWNDFMNSVKASDLTDMIIPIYNKYLTHQEIKELLQFYESPVGKKLISVQPQIFRESYIKGQEWGKVLGEKVMKKLLEEGYTNKAE